MNHDDDHLSPDCRDKKHRACTADAWCKRDDELTSCSCICHQNGGLRMVDQPEGFDAMFPGTLEALDALVISGSRRPQPINLKEA